MSVTFESILATYEAKALAAGHAPSGRACEWRSEIARAIVDRNAPALKVLANGCNPTGLAVFCEVAGIKVPRTQRDQWAAIKAFCCYSDDLDAAAEGKAAAARETKAAARDLEWARNAADHLRVRDDAGNVVTGRQWLESKIADGFNTLRAEKRGGAVTVYDLVKPGESAFYRLTARNWAPVAKYARAMQSAGLLTPHPGVQILA